MRRKKSFRAPFVVTFAGSVVQTAACGGVAAVESHGNQIHADGGGAGGGTPISMGGTGGTGPGGSGGFSVPAETGGVFNVGTGGVINPPPPGECAPEFDFGVPLVHADGSVTPITCVPSCYRDFTCASGPRRFLLSCDPTTGWSVNLPCELPYDHCAAPLGPRPDAECQAGQWQLLGVGGNPPAPCPPDPPVVGSSCHPGAFLGAREHCGYRCPDGTGWTIIGCLASGPPDAGVTPFAWLSDGACDPPKDAGADH